MKIDIKVLLRNQLSLPESAICWVEVLDVSLIDAPSHIVCDHKANAPKSSGPTLLSVELEVPDRSLIGRHLNVRAHLSLTGSKAVQSGDFVTTQAYPVNALVVVELKSVP